MIVKFNYEALERRNDQIDPVKNRELAHECGNSIIGTRLKMDEQLFLRGFH